MDYVVSRDEHGPDPEPEPERIRRFWHFLSRSEPDWDLVPGRIRIRL